MYWLGLIVLVPELFDEIVEVHCFFSCFCGCDDLGFAAGKSNGGLLLACPRDSTLVHLKGVSRRAVAYLPATVRHAREGCVIRFISQSYCFVASKVGKHSQCRIEKRAGG